jgi:hypothetical protein
VILLFGPRENNADFIYGIARKILNILNNYLSLSMDKMMFLKNILKMELSLHLMEVTIVILLNLLKGDNLRSIALKDLMLD